MYSFFHEAELYQLGSVIAVAFNDPKELKKLDPAKQAAYRAVEQMDMSQIPAMLRPVKRHKAEDNGA